jgi:hypothetical protein
LAPPPGEDGLWPENVAAVEAFLAGATQWRRVALADGGMWTVGLDYGGVRVALDALCIPVTAELWGDLQLIESGALAALNKV